MFKKLISLLKDKPRLYDIVFEDDTPAGRKFDIIRREEVDEVKVLGTFDAEARFYEPGRMGQCMVAWNKLYRKP